MGSGVIHHPFWFVSEAEREDDNSSAEDDLPKATAVLANSA
jgi:hypothetical protein